MKYAMTADPFQEKKNEIVNVGGVGSGEVDSMKYAMTADPFQEKRNENRK